LQAKKKGGDKKRMIIVPVKEGDNIERALKRFKRKFEKTGTLRELRSRKHFEKPSVSRKKAKEKAIYVQRLRTEEDQ
jgi:small subunit ribosomal protein S21